jgi:hypothetical protein
MPSWHHRDRTIPPVIIYQDTKLGFLSKTGPIPSDHRGWASALPADHRTQGMWSAPKLVGPPVFRETHVRLEIPQWSAAVAQRDDLRAPTRGNDGTAAEFL